ncbi:MAG: C-terminal helicase domain-containing protein [Ilumatobacteraceae bacterium]
MPSVASRRTTTASRRRSWQPAGEEETQVLIATDVLSEGLNLQDATRLINYDIHWNPVRLMQRIGRVDRRLNPDDRGASSWPTIPRWPQQRGTHRRSGTSCRLTTSTRLLRLYGKVSHKTLLISKTLGIEGKKLLKPEDDYAALKEFNAVIRGARPLSRSNSTSSTSSSSTSTTDSRSASRGCRRAIFSGRERTTEPAATGVFLCYRLPALDTESDEFTLEAGVTRWYLPARFRTGTLLDDPKHIAEAIRSTPGHAADLHDRPHAPRGRSATPSPSTSRTPT